MVVSLFYYPRLALNWYNIELIRWTKGFGAPNIEGHDVAAMFASSLKRLVSWLNTSGWLSISELDPLPTQILIKQNVNAELTALINDTTGTLIASNYVDPNTKIAVIFGTGCNAAYMETAGNIPKMNSVGLPAEQGMAINVS